MTGITLVFKPRVPHTLIAHISPQTCRYQRPLYDGKSPGYIRPAGPGCASVLLQARPRDNRMDANFPSSDTASTTFSPRSPSSPRATPRRPGVARLKGIVSTKATLLPCLRTRHSASRQPGEGKSLSIIPWLTRPRHDGPGGGRQFRPWRNEQTGANQLIRSTPGSCSPLKDPCFSRSI